MLYGKRDDINFLIFHFTFLRINRFPMPMVCYSLRIQINMVVDKTYIREVVIKMHMGMDEGRLYVPIIHN